MYTLHAYLVLTLPKVIYMLCEYWFKWFESLLKLDNAVHWFLICTA